jgi:hypothetical protein
MTWARAAILFVVALAALVAFIRVLEPRFAFFPLPGETTTPANFGVDHEAAALARSAASIPVHPDDGRGSSTNEFIPSVSIATRPGT